MLKTQRDLMREVPAAGLDLVEFRRTNGDHYSLTVKRREDGREATVFFSSTTGDRNSIQRLRQSLRQIVRGTSAKLREPAE